MSAVAATLDTATGNSYTAALSALAPAINPLRDASFTTGSMRTEFFMQMAKDVTVEVVQKSVEQEQKERPEKEKKDQELKKESELKANEASKNAEQEATRRLDEIVRRMQETRQAPTVVVETNTETIAASSVAGMGADAQAVLADVQQELFNKLGTKTAQVDLGIEKDKLKFEVSTNGTNFEAARVQDVILGRAEIQEKRGRIIQKLGPELDLNIKEEAAVLEFDPEQEIRAINPGMSMDALQKKFVELGIKPEAKAEAKQEPEVKIESKKDPATEIITAQKDLDQGIERLLAQLGPDVKEILEPKVISLKAEVAQELEDRIKTNADIQVKAAPKTNLKMDREPAPEKTEVTQDVAPVIKGRFLFPNRRGNAA